MEQISTGAHESFRDPRTVQNENLTVIGVPLVKGGIVYAPEDHDHQHKVGICTAISLTQNRQKANGRKYSPEFQYLLQKKYFDGGWWEGSSILNALKVGKNYGFLPAELWTYTTEDDRYLPYSQYIAKLQAVSDDEVNRLKALCVDKIAGYASVNTYDSQAIAKAIDESEAGILCMYGCSDTWWTPSWLPKDINPIRRGAVYTSGHAINNTAYDYTVGIMQKLSNSWGSTWNLQGNADIDWSTYPMREAWAILKTAPPPVAFRYTFKTNLTYGAQGTEVKMLQLALIELGYLPKGTQGPYGPQTKGAVAKFQKDNAIQDDGTHFGPQTRNALNLALNKP